MPHAEDPATLSAPDEIAQLKERIRRGLMRMAGGDGALPADLTEPGGDAVIASAATATPAAGSDYMAPWLDTEECTACDECINLNPAIFAYNEAKKAFIKDPLAGPYRDLVKAAEKCTAQVIHPGLPADRSEADIDKWIARGAKYN